MKVALVHDWRVTYAGAERVLEQVGIAFEPVQKCGQQRYQHQQRHYQGCQVLQRGNQIAAYAPALNTIGYHESVLIVGCTCRSGYEPVRAAMQNPRALQRAGRSAKS